MGVGEPFGLLQSGGWASSGGDVCAGNSTLLKFADNPLCDGGIWGRGSHVNEDPIGEMF